MEEVDEHLKFSLQYLENRVRLVDNKASILIAVQAGLFAGMALLLDKVPFNEPPSWPRITAFILLILGGLMSATIVALLLQTVRPTMCFLSRWTGIEQLDPYGFVWPSSKPDRDEFVKRPEGHEAGASRKDLASSVYSCQRPVHKKYWAYGLAVLLAKLQICFVVTPYLILTLVGLLATL